MQGRSGFRMRHKISRRNWQGRTQGDSVRRRSTPCAQSPVPGGLFKRFAPVRFARCLDVQSREAPKIVPPLGALRSLRRCVEPLPAYLLPCLPAEPGTQKGPIGDLRQKDLDLVPRKRTREPDLKAPS